MAESRICGIAPALFDFAVEGMAAQVGIILLFFDLALLQFLVARGHVTRNRFPFLTGFRTFQYNVISRHNRFIWKTAEYDLRGGTQPFF